MERIPSAAQPTVPVDSSSFASSGTASFTFCCVKIKKKKNTYDLK